MRYASYVERVLITLWVGSLWSVGYLAAPALFSHLADRRLAGAIAGDLFQIVHGLGLVCGMVLLGMTLMSGRAALRQWRVWVLVAMGVLSAVLLFYIQPVIHDLKAVPMPPGSEAARQFGMWHGISASLYLLLSLLGLVLAGAGLRARTAA